MESSQGKKNIAATIAYEPDTSMRQIIGKTTPLSAIFTPEKIIACQKHVEHARQHFFDVTKNDMEIIAEKIQDNKVVGNLQTLYSGIFQPLCNIKGQAEIFAFPLIRTICRYLLDYCEQSNAGKTLSQTEIIVIEKLFEALCNCLKNRITDSNGILEKELATIINSTRK